MAPVTADARQPPDASGRTAQHYAMTQNASHVLHLILDQVAVVVAVVLLLALECEPQVLRE